MDSTKSNNSYQSTERETQCGEPGFVFTEYDRGARPRENKSSDRIEETAETESQRSHD